jgi:hypothetical protein
VNVPKLAFWNFGCLLVALCAWLTHVVTCIKTASYALLIAGAIMPPIGVVHGWGIWLGLWQ